MLQLATFANAEGPLVLRPCLSTSLPVFTLVAIQLFYAPSVSNVNEG